MAIVDTDMDKVIVDAIRRRLAEFRGASTEQKSYTAYANGSQRLADIEALLGVVQRQERQLAGNCYCGASQESDD